MINRDYFQGKRIAVVGLGPHGELVEDVKFMIKAGALVSVYDLRSEARLNSHLVFLRSVGLANYVCGSIPVEDLVDMDLIIMSHEYPRDSKFLQELKALLAKQSTSGKSRTIPVEYPETFFFRHAPPVTLVGVMGNAGKATVVSMLEPMLALACERSDGQNLFVIDGENSEDIIANLKKVRSGDIVLLRVSSLIQKELFELRISPHVAIFTSIPEKGSYEESPFEVLSYQTYNNFIIAADEIIDSIRTYKVQPKAKMLRTKAAIIPAEWTWAGKGDHDRDNASLALQASRLFKLEDEDVRVALSRWKPLKGRLELVKKVKNVEFYNDTAAVSAHSVRVALEALAGERKVILIFGGAEGGPDYRDLYARLPIYVRSLIILPGSGTMQERRYLDKLEHMDVHSAPSVEEAVRMALEQAQKGDRVIFSPGFEAGGVDRSRKERGERFVRAVRGV